MDKSQLLFFEVTNFRSIYGTQRLDLRTKHKNGRKTTAIYGPNASGKTNISNALGFMKWFVVNSSNASITQAPYEPFLLRDHSSKEDSTFKVEVLNRGRNMCYEFSINEKGITREELTEYLGDGSRRLLFRRSLDGLNSKASSYGFGKKLLESTLNNALLLTKARENNNEYANVVFEWFANSLNVLAGEPRETEKWSLNAIKGNSELKSGVLDLLKEADFWIKDFDIEEVDVPEDILNQLPFIDDVRASIPRRATSVKTTHTVRNINHEVVGVKTFDMGSQESAGTQQFFNLAAPILHTIANGITLYIDEFGTYLHSDICQFIVKLFQSEKINSTGAQLIFNTHDTSLMSKDIDLLKREDIVIVEKNYMEETLITPLTDKSVREGESFEKRYREGIYGGKPLVRIE